MIPQIVLLLLLPYALPLLLPSWRWLLAYAAIAAVVVIIWFTIWYHALMTTPTRTGLEGISLAFVLSAAISTAAGTIVRMVTLAIGSRLIVITISVLSAILIVVATLVWANR